MRRDAAVRLSVDGRIAIPRIDTASRLYERFLGLMGRAPLGVGVGLMLSPCKSVHTCFMRFAIDVVFLDNAGSVLRVARDVRPWRLTWAPWKTHSVIELESGWLPQEAIKKGDRVQIG